MNTRKPLDFERVKTAEEITLETLSISELPDLLFLLDGLEDSELEKIIHVSEVILKERDFKENTKE